ncbi:putative electron-transferring-flavoprotein dehydrogenase [Martiniozyma asiatica (nom. inval.)]|nr:putative electron-transferring-flavoprotein dehydrogenase [Martiniozyma asiatica]
MLTLNQRNIYSRIFAITSRLGKIPTAVNVCYKQKNFKLGKVSSCMQNVRSFTTSNISRQTIETARLEMDEDDLEILSETRIVDTVDVCIVGGGPAGLATAIRLKQLDEEKGDGDLRIIVLEKAPDMGNHIVSGAVLEPKALNELFGKKDGIALPDDIVTLVTEDHMKFLTEKTEWKLPEPSQMKNAGKNYIASLSEVTKYMAEKAEELGVEVFPNTSVSELIFDKEGGVKGVATRDAGLKRDGSISEDFERGMEFHARMTVLAEGCHGSLSKQAIAKYDLRAGKNPQTYGLGIKEIWQVQEDKFKPGYVSHSIGYPLTESYGGGWMYHFGDGLVSVGMVIGLDYKNPWISPYQEFQRMKLHPAYKETLEGGKCISYAARALNEGGWQSVPQLHFPGGVLVGASAGFMNVPKIKGSHTAIKSGMLAAETMYDKVVALKIQQEEELGLNEEKEKDDEEEEEEEDEEENENEGLPLPEWKAINLEEFQTAYENSWIYDELYEVRNVRPSFDSKLGLLGGLATSGLVTMITRGSEPFTLEHESSDAAKTEDASNYKKIDYPKPDGEITFDLMTSVSRTGTYHKEGERCHLRVPDMDLEAHKEKMWEKYQGVEQRFCPAGVYEYVPKDSDVEFKINSQNCIHCKTCDIKVPSQDINWTVPEGGDGPKYQMT